MRVASHFRIPMCVLLCACSFVCSHVSGLICLLSLGASWAVMSFLFSFNSDVLDGRRGIVFVVVFLVLVLGCSSPRRLPLVLLCCLCLASCSIDS